MLTLKLVKKFKKDGLYRLNIIEAFDNEEKILEKFRFCVVPNYTNCFFLNPLRPRGKQKIRHACIHVVFSVYYVYFNSEYYFVQ